MSRGKRKQVALLLVTALLIFSLGSCAVFQQKESPEKERHIIYVYKTTLGDIEFWESVTDGVKTGVAELGYTYEIMGAKEEWDINGNIAALEQAIQKQPDAIVLAAADYKALVPAAQKVKDAGILLITVDSDVEGGVSDCFISTDNCKVGKQMAGEMLDRLDEPGAIAVMGHVENASTTIDRLQGIEEGLKDQRSYTLLPPLYCDNQPGVAREQTKNLLEEREDVKGILATNEVSSLGVGAAIAELGLEDEVVFVACDNATRQIAYLEQKVIDATVIQRPFNMGYYTVKVVEKALDSQDADELPPVLYTEYDVITRENYLSAKNQKRIFPFRE